MDIHVVQQGDTISGIARQYGVSPQRLAADNGISLAGGHSLVVGQALIVLHPAEVYTARPGDTLLSIAQGHGISVMELLQNNPTLSLERGVSPGQSLVIRFEGGRSRVITLGGYAYPYIQPEVLERALPFMTSLTIFGYGFTEEGELIAIDDQALINAAYRYQAAPIFLLSSITEDGTFSTQRASLLFNSPALQSRVIDNMLETMTRKGYLGVDIDFEFIESSDAEGYLGFLRNVTQRMHEYGFTVNVDLAPKVSADQPGLLYEAHDYAAIGAIADTVFLMTYEWGYTYGPPMAVAPIDKVRQVAQYAVSEIPPEKILLGLPNYGYDWPLPYEKGVTQATSIGNQYAVDLAARHGAEIAFDERAQSPTFRYVSGAGIEHEVWFEDVRSMQAKFDLMDELGLLGGGYWNLMRPFAQNWALVSDRYGIRKIL